MTNTTTEILERYQIRKTNKQKTDFIEYIKAKSNEMGYNTTIEQNRFWGVRNIVIGNPDNAKVIYTAHYDTCPVLPFPNFIAPKNFSLYLLYQLIIVAAFFAAAFILGLFFGFISVIFNIDSNITKFLAMALYLGLMLILLCGPANKNTANDNTSGVTTLLDIMAELPNDQRDKVAFVFFDLEEAGLFGSMAFKSKHKAAMKNKLLVNFDCVSDGENMLFILRKKAHKYKELFDEAFESSDIVKSEIITKSIFYPSDHINFNEGVGVGAFKENKRFNILYLDRIHTNKDTVYREENIEFLKQGAIKLAKKL